ncbi:MULTISPECIES: hypothetical protein [Pseudomonas]|uniref:hypothetical protein n=1 Tax=Pseudomonas TaxID=286 RepID=UPI00123B2DEC|nr:MULTISPECIES: hypothetical protein [Pseudomonas]QIB52926.1 hypothetical protein G3M63_18855 [Pseudomonas sp. OIL-1]
MKAGIVKKISIRAMNRLECRGFAPRRQQKGAAALEYLVLAAALVLVLGGAFNTGLETTITEAFNNIFESAASGGVEGG